MTIHLDPTKKHDFVYLFDCKNGNPNGDPDADNQPRQDFQTEHGFVTDVCQKRKIRNYIEIATDQRIFIRQNSILNETLLAGIEAVGLTEKLTGSGDKKKLTDPKDIEDAAAWMCKNYYDVRMFGAVMSTGPNCGQVRGAVQITYAESIDHIFPLNHSITRCAATEVQKKKDGEDKDNKTMGRKNLIPYGLYRSHGFYNPHFGQKQSVTENDMDLFWTALVKMWEVDRSAARGLVSVQGLWVFTHESRLGNYPSHKLFDLIQIESKSELPRSIKDYEIDFSKDSDGIPEGITVTQLA